MGLRIGVVPDADINGINVNGEMDAASDNISEIAGGSQWYITTGNVSVSNPGSLPMFTIEMGKQVNKISQFMLTLFMWVKNGG